MRHWGIFKNTIFDLSGEGGGTGTAAPTNGSTVNARFLAQNAFWSLLIQIFSRGSLTLSMIILARSLDVYGYATYAYFHLIISMLSAYASVGTGVASVRFFSGLSKEGSISQSQTLAALITFSLGSSVMAFLLVMLLPSSFIGNNFLIPRWILSLGVFAFTLNSLTNGAILGLEKFKHMAGISFSAGLFLILGAVWSSWIQNVKFAMWTLIVFGLIQSLIGAMIVGFYLGWYQIVRGFPFGNKDIARIIMFSGPMFFVTLFASTGPWLVGRFILQGAEGEHGFAMFSIGLHWFSLGMLIPTQVSIVLLPKIVRIRSSESKLEDVRKIGRGAIQLVIILSLITILVGVLFGDFILAFYGPNYQLSRWFVGAYLFSSLFSSISAVIGNIIIGNDKPWSWLVFTLFWFIVLCLISFFFKNNGGWTGAVAYSGAYLVMMTCSASYAYKKNLI